MKLLSDNAYTGLLRLDETLDTSGKTEMCLKTNTENQNQCTKKLFSMTWMTIITILLFLTSQQNLFGLLLDPPDLMLYALKWRLLCTAFGLKSNDLCATLAAVARRISTTYIDPSTLLAYTSCRLILLNKCPGVRPIGSCAKDHWKCSHADCETRMQLVQFSYVLAKKLVVRQLSMQ